MADKNRAPTLSAARAAASVAGVLSGLGGITHGIGEALQGNVAPAGIFIMSWTQGPIATNMGGEPAMTLVPNLLATGLLAIVVGLIIIGWSAFFVPRRPGGVVLVLLSIAMLLVGGGFAPPVMGILAGVAGLGVNSPHPWWRRHLPATMRHLFAQAWPWVFAAFVIDAVFLVIGSVLLVYLVGFNNPEVFVSSFLFALVLLLFTIFTGIAYDIRDGERLAGGVATGS